MKYNFNKYLSSTEIVDIAKKLGFDVYVYARDAIPQKLTKKFYVINLDGKMGHGTHWCAFYKQDKNIIYFDSFGFPAPKNEIDVFFKEHDHIYFNKKQIQDLESILCGYFCLTFLYYCYHNQSMEPGDLLHNYDNFFSKDTKKNDAILKKYMNNI